MPTEDAYSSGHLVLSHFGTCKFSNVETILSWPCLVSGLLSFEHPSVLLFLYWTKCRQITTLLRLENIIITIKTRENTNDKSISWYWKNIITFLRNLIRLLRTSVTPIILQFIDLFRCLIGVSGLIITNNSTRLSRQQRIGDNYPPPRGSEVIWGEVAHFLHWNSRTKYQR